MQVEEYIPLASLTTFRIGGAARYFVRAHSADDVREALAYAQQKDMPVFILGGGSNVLVDDSGFDGLVIKMELSGVEFTPAEDGEEILIAGAGESWDGAVAVAVERGLWGIENLSGIPGTVGAAPVQNIGAYGTEVCDTIAWVEAFDMQIDEVVRIMRDECAFEYRTSIFKKESGRYVVLRVAFALSQQGEPRITYPDLQKYFAENNHPSLSEIRNAVLDIRARKFPDLSKEGTAGSFFLNPIVKHDVAARVAERLPGIPQFPQQNGDIKVPLAYMLDKGLGLKGFSLGTVRLFEHQPLVLVAGEGATSHDVRALMSAVQSKVREAYGIDIESEVQFITSNV